MEDWKKDRIGSCERGENSMVIARMKSGFAVIGDNQFLPGYCVLLGYPKAESLNELPLPQRTQFLTDMSLIGDAITMACDPLRINYAIMMNLDRYLHAHIHARYEWEPEEYKVRPCFFYPKEQRNLPEHDYSEARHGEVRRRLAATLKQRMQETGNEPDAKLDGISATKK